MNSAVDLVQSVAEGEDNALKKEYLISVKMIERLQRLVLDVIKAELDRIGCDDVNSVQALLLYNIGDLELTAGEIKTRGYYLGSNVSYNLKKLLEAKCIDHQRSDSDRRAVRISLTSKGKEICALVNRLIDRQLGLIEKVGGITIADLQGLNRTLFRLERFWTDQIRYRL